MNFMKAIGREVWQIYDNIQFEFSHARAQKAMRQRHARQKLANSEYVDSHPPPATPFKYRWAWYCGACDKLNEIYIDKFAAMFQSEQWKIKRCCMHCNTSKIGDDFYLQTDDIDSELIEFWIADDEADFCPQDEDLLIALLPLREVMSALDRSRHIGSYKSVVLVEALVVKFRDGAYEPDEREALTQWISANRESWDQPYIYQYLKDDVNRLLSS